MSSVLKSVLALGLALGAFGGDLARADPTPRLSREKLVQMVLHDPDSPVAGNPKGDVTIVAFLDYNCPYCRRSTAELDHFIKSDPNVRVVFKDWPILGPTSITAAKIALAAKYQGKYLAAHNALMAMNVRAATMATIKSGLEQAGIDVGRLNQDLSQYNDPISDLLRRNMSEADALGFQGTPVFLIGPFDMRSAMDEAGFRQAVSDARARLKQK